jgi:arginase
MWARDDPRPNGLLWDDLVTVLRAAMVSSRVVGLQVTIYNPDMESDRVSGRGLAAVIVDGLSN